MAFFKCKMCGGTIEFEQGATVGVCDSCGTKQTLPNTNDDIISNLYNRANNLRLKGEFDRAEQVYEDIVKRDDSQAEAHWGIVLCKYGIEYVEDPESHKRLPTCHRTSYEAIIADADYKAAIDYADGSQQQIYESEAREIDKIQKGILKIAKEEKPFDVFICYKETDDSGRRTIDSTIANDIYYQLSQEGFRVFYAAITLEDKLGQEYEPYIFAALNSAKVMLVLGTKPEYFNAVWVKNEWSRYLKLVKDDKSKLLIPCYRDMDAYDLPEEFAHLQAQDMGKIGFINDVVRGIKKVVDSKESDDVVKETVVVNSGNVTVEPLLKRAFMFLEDGEWEKADDFCEQVLNQDPENAQAYLCKLMVELHAKKREELVSCETTFVGNKNFQKAIRFGDEKLQSELEGYIQQIENRSRVKLINAKVGETVQFGKYWKSLENVKEDIDWIVLEKRENMILLISKQGLDCKPYNTTSEDVTWETCTLRKWLNEGFINDAFSDDDQRMILKVKVSADKNPAAFAETERENAGKFSLFKKSPKKFADPGNDTEDKIFILSINEVFKYLGSKTVRACAGTEYCYAKGALKWSNGNCSWWVRSPGEDSSMAETVGSSGVFGYFDYIGNTPVNPGDSVDSERNAVRPAMWIKLGD